MNVVKGEVSDGRNEQAFVHAGAIQCASKAVADIISMTSQLMILPLPIAPAVAQLLGAYDPRNPLTMWMMARGTPIGQVHVYLPDAVHQVLTAIAPNPAR
jgi:hypothetical protein